MGHVRRSREKKISPSSWIASCRGETSQQGKKKGKNCKEKVRGGQRWVGAHQSCAVVAGEVLLTDLNEAPEGLLRDTQVLKQARSALRAREDRTFTGSEAASPLQACA